MTLATELASSNSPIYFFLFGYGITAGLLGIILAYKVAMDQTRVSFGVALFLMASAAMSLFIGFSGMVTK